MSSVILAMALASVGYGERPRYIQAGVTRQQALQLYCRNRIPLAQQTYKPSKVKARKARLAKESQPLSEQGRHEQLKLAAKRMLADKQTNSTDRAWLEATDLNDYEALREAIRVVKERK